ncbi:methyl-accepting chemotaxis sensory transducer [Natronobacterium gregoryi SP2]|uniref:Methyl-accepting chemotaxis sensory transducer n=1 Tax=Natronobacterium gregoryi (strain ATCC 43098 / DSM 3393 / CCM 3738 / CIP 104747 / IAM 13177 / JCM 8860 / NBRC 102187 / NCIMB 2189 / SP2) TaxID=797304 RepID=L9Y7G3_NATGS|nr:methyl-accepting chemotaxis protein [Natronobacterium gregoryi]ELY69657.1 methyl-accepting chemotaxis sensory transducer [Natronobacterium gregoryi SP2]
MAILLLGAGYVTFAQVEASVQDDAEETLVNAADREVQGLDQFVRERNNDVARLSGNTALRSDDDEEIREILLGNLEQLPREVEAVHYYNLETSRVEVSTDNSLEGTTIDETERTWGVGPDDFGNALAVRSFEPYETADGPRVGFASPISGQSSHTVVVTVNLADRSDLLISPVDDGVIEVVSTDGQVVLAEEPDDILTEFQLLDELPHLEQKGALAHLEEDDEATGEVEIVAGGHDRIGDDRAVVATIPLEETSWTVATVAPYGTVFDTVGDVTQNIGVLIGISLLGFVTVGAVISRDISNSLDEMTGYAEEIESGNFDVTIEQSRVDEFGQLAGLFARIRETMSEQLVAVEEQAEKADQERKRAKQAKADAEEARETAQQAKADAEELSHHIEQKAEAYRVAIEAAADGDLTCRVDTTSRSQAMIDIGTALNGMLADVEQLVIRIQRVARQLDEESNEVTTSTEEVQASSTDVAESIEEISVGAEQQNEQLTAAATEMSDLSATVEEIASSSDSVADQVAQAAEWGQDGQRAAADAIETMEEIESQAVDTVEEMETLQDEVERIGEVANLIDDIASETNLLAMNASIEAANAADSGDGFAVVADEVKSLAEETSEATQEVERLVETVEESTESVAGDVFAMQSGIENGRETIDETVDTLERIVAAVEDANASVQSINEATDDQAASTQKVAARVDDVTAVSERTAAEAQNVSAAADQQSSAVRQIAENADSLSGRAEELQTLVDRFDTSATDDGEGNTELVTVDD